MEVGWGRRRFDKWAIQNAGSGQFLREGRRRGRMTPGAGQFIFFFGEVVVTV